MRTVEMEITVPEVNGGRCVPIPESELECRIDPSTFAGAWREVCDDSKNIGHYYDVNYARNDPKNDYEPTGSSEICGFCDLGNAWKFIAEDPWEEHSWDETPAPCEEGTGFWVAGGFCKRSGSFGPVAELWYWSYKYYNYPLNGVAMLAMD